MNKFFDANKDVWDDKVEVHKDSEFYNVKGWQQLHKIRTILDIS